MERYTNKNNDVYAVLDKHMEKAILRLGLLEDAYEELIARQAQTVANLENMRIQGREKTARYKETLTQKLVDGMVIAFLRERGFE